MQTPNPAEFLTTKEAVDLLGESGIVTTGQTLRRHLGHEAHRLFAKFYYPRQVIEELLPHQRAA